MTISRESLFSRQSGTVYFLYRFDTDDKKWILYHEVRRRRLSISWGNRPDSQLRGGLHPKKIMCSILWDIHNELFDNNQTITSNLDYDQLHRLKTALDKKKNIPT